MLGRKKGGKTPEAEEAPEAGFGEEDRLLDVIARLLRSCGQHPIVFDERSPEELEGLFETWARHALTASPLSGGSPRESGARDWPKLERLFREHRELESGWVDRSVGDFSDVIWLFVRGLGQALTEDREADAGIEDQLGGLMRAVESGDTGRLKAEALTSIRLIEKQIRTRRARESSQIEELSGQLSRVTSELVGVRSKLGTDSLTGIANRAALDEHISRVISLANVVGEPAFLFMIDVDEFKWVNDRFGHPAGDLVVKKTAETLSGVFRRRGDFLARYGGDEFAAVILEDSSEAASAIAERMLFAMRDLEVRPSEEGEPIRVSVSIGATPLRTGDDAASWIARADRALYRSKEEGRDRASVDPVEPTEGEV